MKRRARPRQAHDEHRSRIAVAQAPHPGQEVGGERRDHPVDELMVLLGIVFQTTPRLGRGLLRVGGLEMNGRLGVMTLPPASSTAASPKLSNARWVSDRPFPSTRAHISPNSSSGRRSLRLMARRQYPSASSEPSAIADRAD